MKQIKYSYSLDGDGNLFNIKMLSHETRHNCKYYCLQCGQEMVANLGTKKAWYFSHKAETACDGESYHCILCEHYKYNDFYSDHICILYKKLALGIQRPKQTMACRCQYYKLNQTLMNHNIEEIEKDIEVVKDFMDMI